jgi:hypothetical protein
MHPVSPRVPCANICMSTAYFPAFCREVGVSIFGGYMVCSASARWSHTTHHVGDTLDDCSRVVVVFNDAKVQSRRWSGSS